MSAVANDVRKLRTRRDSGGWDWAGGESGATGGPGRRLREGRGLPPGPPRGQVLPTPGQATPLSVREKERRMLQDVGAAGDSGSCPPGGQSGSGPAEPGLLAPSQTHGRRPGIRGVSTASLVSRPDPSQPPLGRVALQSLYQRLQKVHASIKTTSPSEAQTHTTALLLQDFFQEVNMCWLQLPQRHHALW